MATRTTNYDVLSQITGLQTTGTGTLSRMTFTYDEVGNRKTIVDLNGARTTYTYDPKNRLTQDATTGLNTHTYDYAYDSCDNRTFSSENGAVTFTYDLTSRLVTSTGLTYTFDVNGNCTAVIESDDYWVSMVYDKENRMVEHHQYDANQDPSLVITTYTYNADSQKRKEETFGEGVVTLIWDGSEYLGEES